MSTTQLDEGIANTLVSVGDVRETIAIDGVERNGMKQYQKDPKTMSAVCGLFDTADYIPWIVASVPKSGNLE